MMVKLKITDLLFSLRAQQQGFHRYMLTIYSSHFENKIPSRITSGRKKLVRDLSIN